MKKREMIILGVAVLAVVYGLLDYLVLSRQSPGRSDAALKQKQTELASVVEVSQIQLSAFSGTDNARVTYMITKAEAEWESDPFGMLSVADTGNDAQGPVKDGGVELHYSGFVKAGRQLLAVINKMEYNIGDALLELGYRVISISQERVVLMTEDSSEIIIPLEEN
ncbi:MAG: hypothetical protein V1793_11890 [Pseudomonadota bacterium]